MIFEAFDAARWTEWDKQWISKRVGTFCFILVSTELCLPLITLAPSVANPMQFYHGIPLVSNNFSISLKIVAASASMISFMSKNMLPMDPPLMTLKTKASCFWLEISVNSSIASEKKKLLSRERMSEVATLANPSSTSF